MTNEPTPIADNYKRYRVDVDAVDDTTAGSPADSLLNKRAQAAFARIMFGPAEGTIAAQPWLGQ